jgi:penicillin-binding protein 1A
MSLQQARSRVRQWVIPRWERTRPHFERVAARLRLDRITDRHLLIAAAVSSVFAFTTYQRCGLTGCPNVQRLVAYQPGGATILVDRNGKRFADLAPIRYQVVPIKTLPKHIPDAFLAVEDKRFYNHAGVDWKRVGGAALANIKSRGVAQGSSTITMQLARNLFPKKLPSQERTFRRKLLEVRVARSIERKFEKDEILELYLNHIYFGNGAYGIEAAAQQYFRKRAKDLSVSQAAVLAALPKAPAHYDPRRRPFKALKRRDLVIALMERQGRLTPKVAALSRKAPLRIERPPRRSERAAGLAPYFVDAVRKQLEDKFGDAVYESKLVVHTTLDITAQRAAEEEMFRQLKNIEAGSYGKVRAPQYNSNIASDELGTRYLQGAVVVLEARTGAVLAQVGGRDFLDSPFNRATQGMRQVGSAFKPFVYAAAIEEGITTTRKIADEPLSMNISRNVVWRPKNYDGEFMGEVSVREALVHSRNVPTIRLAGAVGNDDIMRVAQQAGIRGRIDDNPSMPLGTVAASPLELASAYAIFATGGVTGDPHYIVRVKTAAGEVLWEPETTTRVNRIDPAVAYIVTDILRDAVDRGTGAAVRSVGFYGAAAGKTGTTNEGGDAWFVGYTPDLVSAVWVGYDQRRTIVWNATGGRLAAPVWGRMMRRIYARRPDPGDFQMPAGVVRRSVDPASGLVLEDGCWPSYDEPASEVFLEGTEPGTVCPNRNWVTDLFEELGEQINLGRLHLDRIFGPRREPTVQARRPAARPMERVERERRAVERERRATDRSRDPR